IMRASVSFEKSFTAPSFRIFLSTSVCLRWYSLQKARPSLVFREVIGKISPLEVDITDQTITINAACRSEFDLSPEDEACQLRLRGLPSKLMQLRGIITRGTYTRSRLAAPLPPVAYLKRIAVDNAINSELCHSLPPMRSN